MLTRNEQNDRLTIALSNLSTAITNKSKQSMLDDNRVIETILTSLLNELYGLNLVDLNRYRYNHPAIDLGDYFKGKAFQITADGSHSKMVETIAMLEKHELDKTFKDITFLIISNSPKQSFQRKGYIIKIMDLGDIARDICHQPQEIFDRLNHFCENQFRSYFPNNNQSIFQPVIQPSNDPCLDISNFMFRNGYNEPYDIPMDTVRNGLIALKNILTTLNDDQRWYIYKIMNYAIQQVPDRWFEYCIAPYSYMAAGLRYDQTYAFQTTAKSIDDMNLGYYECEGSHKFNFPFFALFFSANLDDFNFFGAICRFLAQNYNQQDLVNIVVNCDFSNIN
ncbi:SMEK domain-containing protein [Acinetobacter baumannii]|nr:SMEK domain-containing protein [Acinetobacter baumannii]